MTSCNTLSQELHTQGIDSAGKVAQAPVQKVLTAEDRVNLTPYQLLQQFKEVNERFRTNNYTNRNHSTQIRNSAVGQYSKAVVLSCLDSRVPV